MRTALLAAVLFAAGLGLGAEAPAVALASGHRLPVTALRYDASRNLLFSISEDGLLVAWDPVRERAVSRLHLSHLPLRQLAVHPSLPQVAVVESDVGVSRLSIWDWREGRRLWMLELDMPPSTLAYSNTGRYLVVCRKRFDSLLFLDPVSGERLPPFVGGFGIVSFVTFNSDDAIMMSYQANGDVRYWDVASQEQILPTVSTEPLLWPVALTGSESSPKDSVVGWTGRHLVLADIVHSGAVRERIALPSLVALEASDRGDVLSLTRDREGVRLTRWLYRPPAGLVRLSEEALGGPTWPGGVPVAFASGMGELYVGCEDGSIVTLPRYGTARLFSRNEIAAVSDLALSGTELLVALPGRLLLMDISGFAEDRMEAGLLAPEARVVSAPLPGSLRLATSPEGEVWAWSPEASRGELYRVFPEPMEGTAAGLVFMGPIAYAAWSGPELSVVERNGLCSLFVRGSEGGFVSAFSFLSPGANAMVSTAGAVLIGRSTLQRGDGPLLLVDRRTGETAPLSRGDGLVYELVYEPEADSVLSLGVSRGTSAWSSLSRSGGAGYLESQLLVEYRGEDTGGDVVRSADGVFTSLGYEVARLGLFDPPDRQRSVLRSPRRLAAAPGVVASVNLDGSVTIWRQKDLEPLADLFVFRDGEWLLTAGGQVTAASPGGARYLSEER